MSDRYIWQLKAIRRDIANIYSRSGYGGAVTTRDIMMQASGVLLGFCFGLAVASGAFAIFLWVTLA